MESASEMHFVGSTCKVLKTEDYHFGKHILMLVPFTTLYQPTVFEQVVHTKTGEILDHKILLSPRLPPKVILKSVWQVQDEGQVQQESTGRQVADQVTITPEVGLRFQGVPHEEPQQDEENSQKRYIGRLAHGMMLHPNKNALIAEMQSNSPYTTFSEESKQMIHTQGNTEGFKLCQITHKFQVLDCIVHCDCGICIVLSETNTKTEQGEVRCSTQSSSLHL